MSVTHVTGTGDYSKPVPVQVAIFKNPRQSSNSVHALCPIACSDRGDCFPLLTVRAPDRRPKTPLSFVYFFVSECDIFAETQHFPRPCSHLLRRYRFNKNGK